MRSPQLILSVFCLVGSWQYVFSQGQTTSAQHLEARIKELHAKFRLESDAREQRSGTTQRYHDERVSIEALIAIIDEERSQRPLGILYEQAIAEIGKYSNNPKAVQALVDNLDEPQKPTPRLTQMPLEHFVAARALVNCGGMARHRILESLGEPHSRRKVHLMAYVLAMLDQTAGRPFDVQLTVIRLADELKWIESASNAPKPGDEVRRKNIDQIMSIIRLPQFSVLEIPLPRP